MADTYFVHHYLHHCSRSLAGTSLMAEYTNITLDEMVTFLETQGFRRIELDGTTEFVWSKRVDANGHPLSLRIYTGINPDGNSRGVGDDAIRCAIFWLNHNGERKKVASSKRVHRVKNWRVNLQERINSLTLGCINNPNCPACTAPMVERKSNNGTFYGCGNFPECRQTKKKEA